MLLANCAPRGTSDQRGSRRSERLSNGPKVMQLVSSEARIEAKFSSIPPRFPRLPHRELSSSTSHWVQFEAKTLLLTGGRTTALSQVQVTQVNYKLQVTQMPRYFSQLCSRENQGLPLLSQCAHVEMAWAGARVGWAGPLSSWNKHSRAQAECSSCQVHASHMLRRAEGQGNHGFCSRTCFHGHLLTYQAPLSGTSISR